jgi:hypothetical protein
VPQVLVGVLGHIVAGDDQGWFVEVVDDSDGSTGGYYILTFDRADRSGIGYDNWVESLGNVHRYFH